MSSREEFEAAMLSMEQPGIGWISIHWFDRGIDGESYADQYIQGQWLAWQASRAALTVKLGKRWSNQDGDWFEDEDGDSLDYRETVQALEAAGVQVKP